MTATNPVGPAGQPQKYAVAVSNPGATQPGLLTFVDFSGDTIISTPSIQANPNYIALLGAGTQGFTINTSGVFDSFPSSAPASLITSGITTTTLNTASTPQTIAPVNLAGSSATVFVPQPGLGSIAGLTSTGTLIQTIGLSAAVGTPSYVVGADGASRIYALAQGSGGGTASSIEASTTAGLSITATLPVGSNPVYGVMTADARRAFVMNKGSQSVSVINVINNTLDVTTHLPTGTISLAYTNPATGAATTYGMNPVWADLSATTNELAVLSAGDGTNPGLLTIISIPLCNAQTQTGAGSSACDATNPVDAAAFGTIVAQIPVGVNATEVSVLGDGSQAYVANAGSATVNGSVSIVNMATGTLIGTIGTGADNTTNMNAAYVFGLHPNSIAATNASPTGKVYVTSSDSRYLSVLETDTDLMDTHVPLQGAGVRVVVTSR